MRGKIRGLMAGLTIGLVLTGVALAASSPSVVTGSATHIGDNSAVLNGTVNPNGSATTYYFQWGLNTSYGVNGKPHSAGSGTKAVSVSEAAKGLIPGTTYHYRLVASNRYGTSVGRDRMFTTAGHPPPNASTGPATGLSASGATLTGVINPNGQQTTWSFQYGVTTAYGSQTFGGSIPAGGKPVDVASAIQGLQAGTVFHYRLVAAHANAPTSYGADATFMTYPSRRPVPRLRAETAPHRVRHRPFTLITTGHVLRPSSIPAGYACTGNVEVLFFHRTKRVASTFLALQPNCGSWARRPSDACRAGAGIVTWYRSGSSSASWEITTSRPDAPGGRASRWADRPAHPATSPATSAITFES